MTESDTRKKILLTSIRLFNEKSAMEVGTNHIAAACNISVGNLYYHFKSKEEIIRSIFQLIKERGDTSWMPEGWSGQDLEPLVRIMDLLFQFYEQYVFLFRDYNYIMRKDPEMAIVFRDLIQIRRESSAAFWEKAQKAGLLKKVDVREAEVISHNFWLIHIHWYSYTSILGITDRKVIASRGILQTLIPMRSILTRRGNEMLDRALEPYFRKSFAGYPE